MSHSLASLAAKDYAEMGRIPYCPKCHGKSVTTKGFIYGSRGSLSVFCADCGEIGHFDGLAIMHRNADPDTITDLSVNVEENE